jgi:N-acetylglucosamine-6-sulfatase
MLRRFGAGLALLAAATLAAGLAAPAGAATRPNIVVIVTDDQRADALDRMPAVRSRLAGAGITFANAFVGNPLCCPSRATLLTGLHSHSTAVWNNEIPFGGHATFAASRAENRTIAVALDAAGYRTIFVGKYLNGYSGPDVPPGWDDWRAFNGAPGYFGYELTVNGRRVRYGHDAREYSTDVLGGKAARAAATAREPFLLVFSPAAPHRPATPAPRHANVRLRLPGFAPPSFGERDLSDKPAYVRAGARPLNAAQARFRERQYRSLLAVDDAVARILDALERSGRLHDTIVVFTSDNGVEWGEHGFPSVRKGVPYDGATRVPLVVRYDALVAGPRTETRLISNADLAPTLAELAGVRFPTEGRSLLPLLRGELGIEWRTELVVESAGGEDPELEIPSYCGVRSARYSYVLYATGEEELYDLSSDPFQLESRAGEPAFRAVRREALEDLRSLCFPLPPGYRPRALCTRSGTPGAEELVTGLEDDYVCPGGGRDTVLTGGGADTVDVSPRSVEALRRATFYARATGAPGSRIVLGSGGDRLLALNARADVVLCGFGADRVVVDAFDVVGADCERVARPPR